MNNSWGFHLILDLSGCDIKLINSRNNIQKCIDEMILNTNMTAWDEPIYKYLKPTTENIKKRIDGYSVVQFIKTSSITMHFVNSDKAAYIDFFSCKKFFPKGVKKIVIDYFKPTKIKARFIKRSPP